MYVVVARSGTVTLGRDFRLNASREAVTFGLYDPGELSLARAHVMTLDARRSSMEGNSPAHEKQRANRRIKAANSFGEFGER